MWGRAVILQHLKDLLRARTSLNNLREQISSQYDGLSKMKIDSDVKLIDLGKDPQLCLL